MAFIVHTNSDRAAGDCRTRPTTGLSPPPRPSSAAGGEFFSRRNFGAAEALGLTVVPHRQFVDKVGLFLDREGKYFLESLLRPFRHFASSP